MVRNPLKLLPFRYYLAIFAVCNSLLVGIAFYYYFPVVKNWYIERSYRQLVANTQLAKPGFVEVMSEKTALELQVITSIVQGTNDRDANIERLAKQSREISKVIAVDFGEEKEKQLFELLAEYDAALIEYCIASKEKNTDRQTQAIIRLTAFPKQYAKFFSGLSINIGYETIQFGMAEYQATIKTTVDSQITGDFKVAFTHADQAKLQSRQLATIIEHGLLMKSTQ